MDKKKLLDVDRLQSFPSEISQKAPAAVDGWIEGQVAVQRRTSVWCLMVVFIAAFLAASFLITAFFASSRTDDNVAKFRTSFVGSNAHVVDQEVVSFSVDNIVEYYITASIEERVTIVEDFNQAVQITKISTPYSEVCYVSELKKDSYVRPSDIHFGAKTGKGYVSQVYEASENPIDDATILGRRGSELCQDQPVYWIHPATDASAVTISPANFTSSSVSSPSGVRSRSKRNIRQCRTSCCWQVCCCDVHHFNWETVEHFTCNHICQRCTPAFKQVIRRLCTN